MKNSIGITVESIISDHCFMVRMTETDTFEISYDRNKIDSALNSIYQTWQGVELYPTKIEKAARLFFNLLTCHAFTDGNKRIACYEMLKFLRKNSIYLNFQDIELEKLVYDTLEKKDFKNVVSWINKHLK